MLITGLHTVVDIFCTCCSANLGWKYVRVEGEVHREKTAPPLSAAAVLPPSLLAPPRVTHNPPALRTLTPTPTPPHPHKKTTPNTQEHAFEETQKYKEGKFIVETARVLKQGW